MSYMHEMKNYHRLSPTDLSINSIKTLRRTSAIGLLACLCCILTIWGIIPVNIWVVMGLICLGSVGFLSLIHRLPNLLMLTDKHLDEWDQKLKKDAESFTFRVIYYFMLFLLIPVFMGLGSDLEDLNLVMTPSLQQIGLTLFFLPLVLQLITICFAAWNIEPLSASDIEEMSEKEYPRKQGKWMISVSFFAVILIALGGLPLDYFLKNSSVDMNQTCILKMETKVQLLQLKNLNDCQSLSPKEKK